MKSVQECGQILKDEYGYENMLELMEECGLEPVVPAVCRSCGATFELEPDARDGRCDECGKGPVESVLVMYGLI